MCSTKLWVFLFGFVQFRGKGCARVCFLKLITAGSSESTASGIMCWPFLKDMAVHCLDRCFGSAFIQLPVPTILKVEGKFH